MTINSTIDQLYFDRLLDRHQLTNMWLYVVQTNKAKDVPYHNTLHLMGVAMISHRLLQTELNYLEMTARSRTITEKILLMATLWHDYNHSGGKLTDEENIQAALEGLRDYCQVFEPELMEEFVLAASELIRVTQYDGPEDGFRYIPNQFLEYVIRDADLLYTFQDRTSDIVQMLFLELKLAGKLGEMGYKDFLGKQREFINKCRFYTEMGQQIHRRMANEILHEQQLHIGQ